MTGRFSALRAFLLLIAVLLLPALACDFSVSTASITNGVMAKDVQGDKFEPVDITSTYSANQGKFHAVVTVANAPSDTLVKGDYSAITKLEQDLYCKAHFRLR